MKKAFLLTAMLTAIFFAGCRDTIIVNGKSCAMLRDSELREMQSLALATLKHNLGKDNVVTMAEYRHAAQTTPESKIHYFTNLTGRAEYTWDFSNRKTTVVIQGEFLNDKQRLVFVSVQPKLPAVIDTTHKLPKNAPVFREKRQHK